MTRRHADEQGLRNRLGEWRAERGWSQSRLADVVGVSRKTTNTVENGVFVPSAILALRLAGALGVAVEDVFELEEKGDWT